MDDKELKFHAGYGQAYNAYMSLSDADLSVPHVNEALRYLGQALDSLKKAREHMGETR